LIKLLDELQRMVERKLLERVNLERIRKKMGKVYDHLDPHLEKEEQVVRGEILNEFLSLKDRHELAAQEGRIAKKYLKTPSLEIPVLYYSLNEENRKVLEESMPWIVPKVLVPFVWKGRYKGLVSVLPFHPENHNQVLKGLAQVEIVKTRENLTCNLEVDASEFQRCEEH